MVPKFVTSAFIRFTDLPQQIFIKSDGYAFLFQRKLFPAMGIKFDASVVCVGPKSGMWPTSQGGAQAPLSYTKALWRKAVKAAAGEAQPVP